MTETKQTSTTKADRRPDSVTEIRRGNSVLTVSGFFKQGATDTAADKMMKVLEAEAATQKTTNDLSIIKKDGHFQRNVRLFLFYQDRKSVV